MKNSNLKTERTKNPDRIIEIAFMVIFVLGLFYAESLKIENQVTILSNPEVTVKTKAEVWNISLSKRGSMKVYSYQFLVDGKKVKSSTQCEEQYGVSIGDSIWIIYSKEDPYLSRMIDKSEYSIYKKAKD